MSTTLVNTMLGTSHAAVLDAGSGVSLISTFVVGPITLGSAGYASTVTVTSTGTISSTPTVTVGYGYQVTMGSSNPTLINDGLIDGGIATGTINADHGVKLSNGYLLNAGTILGGTSVYGFPGKGIVQTGGVLLNTGLIGGGSESDPPFGPFIGVGLDMSGGYAKNEGRIANSVELTGGTFVNATYVQDASSSEGTFINDGTLDGATAAYGGTLANRGDIGGVEVGFGNHAFTGLLINSGTIFGGINAVEGGNFFNSGSIGADFYAANATTQLTLAPGSVIDGPVRTDSNVSNRLDLASGASGGRLDMAGTFYGFSTIAFDPGAAWVLGGTAADLAGGQSITGFGPDDTLVLDGFSETARTFVSGRGLELGNTTIDIIGSFVTSDFTVATDGTSTTITTDTAPCFCAGTAIRTPHGDIPVEDLAVGDEVMTAFAVVQRIKWIGRRSYEGHFIAGNRDALPVCLKAGAIADGIPARDLWVSPDHAICEGGVLIHAWRLVNGVSIFQANAVEHVEYFHVELEGHHIVFAEDCPAESFLDTDCRQRFANAHEYAALYRETEPGKPCLPLVQSGFHLENIRGRLAERAGIAPHKALLGTLRGCLDEAGPELLRGWAQDVSALEVPVALALTADGKPFTLVLANAFRADLRAAGLGSGCHAFSLPFPPGARQVEIRRASDGALLGRSPLPRAA